MNSTGLLELESLTALTNLVLDVIQPHAAAGIIDKFLELLFFERTPSREKLKNRDPESPVVHRLPANHKTDLTHDPSCPMLPLVSNKQPDSG